MQFPICWGLTKGLRWVENHHQGLVPGRTAVRLGREAQPWPQALCDWTVDLMFTVPGGLCQRPCLGGLSPETPKDMLHPPTGTQF